MIALSFILALVALVWGYSAQWAKWTDGKIRLSIRVEEEHVVEGEEGSFWLTLENRSWLPIPWLEIAQPLPEGVHLIVNGEERSDLLYRTFLLPRQRLQRRYPMIASRGPHRFDKAELSYGEGLGLRDVHDIVHSEAQIFVRPRLLDDLSLPIPLPELIGEKSILRWYAEDTSRMLGTRSYQQGDPYKHIHWSATARTGRLMVKQFETTSETDFFVLLNGQLFDPYWAGTRRRIVDEQCRLTATLCRYAEQEGYTYGLFTNLSWHGVGGLTVPPDRSPLQLEAVFTALSGLMYRASGPFAEYLNDLQGRIKPGSTIVLMTAYWNEEIAVAVERLRSEGHHLALVAFGSVADRLHGLSPAVTVIPYLLDEAEEEALEEALMETSAAHEVPDSQTNGETPRKGMSA